MGRSGVAAVVLVAVLPAPAQAVAFSKFAYCYWRAKEPGAVYDRVSVEAGDDNPFIVFNDPAFRKWSESARYTIELSANHQPRRVRIRGAWADVVPQLSTLSAYLDADARRLVGGATSVQLWRGGKLLVDVPLENTPSAEQLNACVRRDGHDDKDEER